MNRYESMYDLDIELFDGTAVLSIITLSCLAVCIIIREIFLALAYDSTIK
jgi:hypothetical protein